MMFKSTLPNTKSNDPNNTIRSPRLIYLLNLFILLMARKSLEIIKQYNSKDKPAKTMFKSS